MEHPPLSPPLPRPSQASLMYLSCPSQPTTLSDPLTSSQIPICLYPPHPLSPCTPFPLPITPSHPPTPSQPPLQPQPLPNPNTLKSPPTLSNPKPPLTPISFGEITSGSIKYTAAFYTSSNRPLLSKKANWNKIVSLRKLIVMSDRLWTGRIREGEGLRVRVGVRVRMRAEVRVWGWMMERLGYELWQVWISQIHRMPGSRR